MKVVAINRIIEAQTLYPDAYKCIYGWYQIMSQGEFKSEQSLKSTFGNLTGVNHRFEFPIPETDLLVHTLINFESQVAYIDKISPSSL